MNIDQFPNFRTPKTLLLRWKRLLYAEGISRLETALISRIDTKIALVLSELHVFRGHQPSPTDFIMGHEFTGIVDEVGSGVKTVKKGDKIVSPFTVSW